MVPPGRPLLSGELIFQAPIKSQAAWLDSPESATTPWEAPVGEKATQSGNAARRSSPANADAARGVHTADAAQAALDWCPGCRGRTAWWPGMNPPAVELNVRVFHERRS